MTNAGVELGKQRLDKVPEVAYNKYIQEATMKDKLYSEVWTKGGGYCSEMGLIEPVYYGRVVRQTAKTIWIKDQFNQTTKWNLQPSGSWKSPSSGFGNIQKAFEFNLDPLTKFIYSKELKTI
jgi:hypothetical protein